ncbi:hypothetical protein [Haloarchaeobius sp. HRN-SO-5]|uniref:hypothetical protein n=1 Tax=Haloarchaeobius sp. HRN-SO-5 TaxID=3446118 RepID=UPI003EB84A07
MAAGVILYPGVRRFLAGAPTEDWIVDVVLGVLLLTLYLGTRLAYWVEGDQSADGFQLSDWTILVTSGLWVLAGAVFLSLGFSSIGVLGFTFFGAIGVVAMLYRLYVARSRSSTNGM